MKARSMTAIIKKLVVPVACGMLLCATGVRAQTLGDVVGFRAAPSVAGNTFYAPGDRIEFVVRLGGPFVLQQQVVNPIVGYPMIKMLVGTGGSVRYATLMPGGWNYSNHGIAGMERTDLYFEYVVQPGDMAAPLLLDGQPTLPFTFIGGDYLIKHLTTGVGVDWRVNQTLYNWSAGDGAFSQYDYNIDFLSINIETLYFDTLICPSSIIATETRLCRVCIAAPVPSTTEAFTIRIWTPDTGFLQIVGTGVETFGVGDTYKDFLVKGIANGPATIYVQRQSDFSQNASGVKNAITHTLNVTPPPDPTVRVIFPANMGLDTLYVDETTTPNVGSFKIALSETYPTPVYVKIEAMNFPGFTNIVLTTPTAGYYVVPANQFESTATYLFSPVDGTWDSETGGVEIRPTVTNGAAAAHYTEFSSGTVYVKNVQPVTTVTVSGNAMQGIPFDIGWDVSDVVADIEGGIVMQWNFGDGTPSVTVTNTTPFGIIPHTYNSLGTKSGTVVVRELKDITKSTTVPFTVNVIPPVPTPSVSVVMDNFIGVEGTNGWLWVVLSETCVDFVTVTLSASTNGVPLVGGGGLLSFSNPTVPIPNNGSRSNMVPVRVDFLDGTAVTGGTGISITPTIISTATAIAQFPTINDWPLYVINKAPTISYPAAQLPSATPNPPYHAVPYAQPFTYRATVGDVQPDIDANFLVEWQFDGGGWIPADTGSGTTYYLTHTVGSSLGLHIVEVRATDKDGGSTIISFPINVIPAPPNPGVTVMGSNISYPEMNELTGAPGGGQLTVVLSEVHNQPVRVNLALIFPAGPNPGSITLAQNYLIFNPGQTSLNVGFTIQDGTLASQYTGFKIVPSIPAGDPGELKYITMTEGYIYVHNVAPIISTPSPFSTNTIATVGLPRVFNWNITDILADRAGLTNVWDFGDGTAPVTTYGPTGVTNHTYVAAGDNIQVTLTSTDKDGLPTTIIFYVTIKDSKRVYVTPIGPNSGDFNGMPGTGYGWISTTGSTDNTPPTIELDYIHAFYFPYTTLSAAFFAHPMQPGEPEHFTPSIAPGPQSQGMNPTSQKSFFFVWAGEEDLFQNKDDVNVPLSSGTASGFTLVKLNSTGGAGTQGGQQSDAISIKAIFSLEWIDGTGDSGTWNRDDCGDINQDGIPDKYVSRYFLNKQLLNNGGGGNAGGGIDPIWFTDLRDFNADDDWWPRNPDGVGGVWDFRPIPYPGNAFTAYLERRGRDNRLDDQPSTIPAVGLYNDDPETDPTKADTDGDGFPDGWEYWFWEAAYNRGDFEHGRGGWRYDPLNVGQGEVIEPGEIYQAFNPAKTRKSAAIDPRWYEDFDNDGLLDIEELFLGTDPTNWDTDGDGMADGWEVLMGLNPCDASDGLNIAFNNPDGDYFAIAAVPRLLVTVVTTNEVIDVTEEMKGPLSTNRYLARISGGLPQPGSYTACYRYGDDKAPWAVGLPVADTNVTGGIIISTTVEAIDALLLHFQVRDEFGFDPRTAWCGSVRRGPNMPNRFPQGPLFTCTDVADDPTAEEAHSRLAALAEAHGITRWGGFAGSDAPYTRRFTSVDEYLLMKFMYELRLNGAAALHEKDSGDKRIIGMRSRGYDAWLRFSTHPKTPDTGATPYRAAGVPDGWKLYVATAPGTYGNFTHSPWDNLDGADVNADGDTLSLQREFWATDSLPYYANPAQYSAVVPYAAGEIQPDNSVPEAAIILFRTGLTNSVGALSRVWTAQMQGVVTIVRPDGHGDNAWLNKFWPTNPWDIDTDGDGLCDGWESGYFIYGTPTDNGSPCIPGGGLNPCSVDTDHDGLPDAWEACFMGTPTDSGGTLSIRNGMDGTVMDAHEDWDNDGLENCEEYLTQALRSFRYDIPDVPDVMDDLYSGQIGLPMDMTFEIADVFVPTTNMWDQGQLRLPGEGGGTLWYMLPPETEGLGFYSQSPRYSSTDPRLSDTDNDGMDDFYELFHGLNPMLGDGGLLTSDRIAWAYRNSPIWWDVNWWVDTYGLNMDFVNYPWLNGMPMSDPDADGLLNLEEMLLANSAAPECYNTDPTPMWMTDASNPYSITARSYPPTGSGLTVKWAGAEPLREMYFWRPLPMFMYPFEMNEGYDTDNDGISDKDELIGNRNPMTDPRDSESPFHRQAMWFSGENSAAITPVLYNDLSSLVGGNLDEMEQAFRSFTVELWVRPQRTLGFDQVLIERVFNYGASDLSMTEADAQRRNFVIGIAADGRAYAGYDNAGGHDAHTDSMRLYGQQIPVNEWTHLTARMDGRAKKFSLLVNGIVLDTVDTALVPINGIMQTFEAPVVIGIETNAAETATIIRYDSGALVLGAANNVLSGLRIGPGAGAWPAVWADFDKFYQGWMDEVRVWDGARSNGDIYTDYQRRLTYADMMENRRLILAETQAGASRVKDAQMKLSPLLMNYYTFNSLFSAREPGLIAKVPRGFHNWAVVTNRPADVNVPWWERTEVHSMVYDDYTYLPWIQNVAAHLPMYSVFTNNVTGMVSFGMNNVVADSFYWRTDWTGRMAAENHFPNRNNPYGFAYRSRVNVSADMLPLGDAFVRQCIDLWDGQGPTGTWLEDWDTRDDGLPQWWIDVHGTTTGWNDLYSGTNAYYQGSGMENGEAYQRDLAHGTQPDGIFPQYTQTADSDGDGLPDWWERIYGLDPLDPTGDNGTGGDPDLDGLSNYAEYLISEIYQFRLSNPRKFKTNVNQKFSDYFEKDYYVKSLDKYIEGKVPFGFIFSDHDFVEDWWEDLYAPTHANRFVYDPLTDYDWDGWSNWAEARYSLAVRGIRPDLQMQVMPGGSMNYEIPIPVVKTFLSYKGLQATGNVVINAFSDPEMNGVPDATWSLAFGGGATPYTLPLGFFDPKTIITRLTPGSVVPGTVTMRFTDMWTGQTATSGFDMNGTLYTMPVAGMGYEQYVGEVDYVTGEIVIDMSVHQNHVIILDWDAYTNGVREAAIDIDMSYVEVEYDASLPNAWPQTLYLGMADSGYLREGTNYFVAYMTTGTQGGGAAGTAPSWVPGDPLGVATPFGTDIGWDMNSLNIQLTDYTPGYLRMALDGTRTEDAIFGDGTGSGGGSSGGGGGGGQGGLQSARVRVIRTGLGGSPTQATIFDKVITGRNYIHEGDFFNYSATSGFGLDWGNLTGINTWAVYQVGLGNAEVNITSNLTMVTTFTNSFYTLTAAKAVALSPAHGGYVYSARPTFRWSMPDTYTAFAIELRKSTSSGTLLYPVTARQLPLRDPVTGDYVWQAPFYIGDLDRGMVNNGLYYWRVVALNSKASIPANSVWSDWQQFRWDVNQPMQSSGYGQVNATVKYFGPAVNLSNKVVLEAYDNRGFTGDPAARYVIPSAQLAQVTDRSTATNAFMRGLVPGTYYLRAYIDSNGNGIRDIWESWGYANYYGEHTSIYNARPAEVTFSALIPAMTVIIEDCDVDQDWFPDAWEYEQNPGAYPGFLNAVHPQDGWKFGDAEQNPFLDTTAGWTGFGLFPAFMSSSGQGQANFLNMLAGLQPAADGFTQAQKMKMGLLPSDVLGLRIIKSPSINPATTEVVWKMTVQRDKTEAAMLAHALSPTAQTTKYKYRIRYTPTLEDDSQWRDAKGWTNFTLKEGVNEEVNLEETLMSSAGLDMTRGFFKVEVAPQ